MTIQGKKVNFRVERINKVDGLKNADMGQFQAIRSKKGTWMENILRLGKEVLWAIIKRDMLINDFTIKARLWINII